MCHNDAPRWNFNGAPGGTRKTFLACLFRATGSAIEVMFLALHSRASMCTDSTGSTVGKPISYHRSLNVGVKLMCHTDAPLWSASEIDSMALPAEQERHTESG